MAAEKKAATPTEYVVLKKESLLADNWAVVQSVSATSASGAIRAALAKNSLEEQTGTFVAVPARSWKPTKVAPKTTVQLELTEVKA